MTLPTLQRILNSDSLSEGREKINSAIDRVGGSNNGLAEFNDVVIYNNVEVRGTLTTNTLVQTTSESIEIGDTIVVLGEEDIAFDLEPRGVGYRYRLGEESGVLEGFFGLIGSTDRQQFVFYPNKQLSSIGSSVQTSDLGIIRGKFYSTDIIDPQNLITSLSAGFVNVSDAQIISGSKRFTGTTNFSGLVISSDATQGSQPSQFVIASRSLIPGDGITIDNSGSAANLTADRTIRVDSNVVRTFGQQSISGNKTFTSDVTFLGSVTFSQDGFVSLSGNQTILGQKTFRPGATNDGISIVGRAGGSSDHSILFETVELTGNRTVTFPNANVTVTSGTLVNIESEQTITGLKKFSSNIEITNSSGTRRGLLGQITNNDYWFVGGIPDTNPLEGGLEIAAGGNTGAEFIYASQYSGTPSSGVLQRRVTLLDNIGNSSFPGKISASIQATDVLDVVLAGREVQTGSGLTGGGNLTSNRTISLDSTVPRTTGNYTIDGVYTFSNTIQGNSATATRLATPININNTPFDGSSDIFIEFDFEFIKGGGPDESFIEADNKITTNYSITPGKNAISLGPLAITPGVTVSVPVGSTWTILGTGNIAGVVYSGTDVTF